MTVVEIVAAVIGYVFLVCFALALVGIGRWR